MPTSSPLSIATNAVTRLLKEQHFYEKDQLDQRKQISDAKAAASTRGKGDADEAGNEEFLLKQRETALAETDAVLKQMPDTVRAAREKLEGLLASKSDWDAGEVEKAKEAINQAIGNA